MAATTISRFLLPPSNCRENYSIGRRLCRQTLRLPHLQNRRNWRFEAHSRNRRVGMVIDDYREFIEGDEDEDDDEDDGGDRSLDLLIRFMENVYRNLSKRARKAVKSILPVHISSRLVGFAVNGTIILTFMWILKALLEVVCTLGSVVFSSILVIRGVCSMISYFSYVRSNRRDDEDDSGPWSRAQPAF